MTLPKLLQNIFQTRNKSYKMVLILSLLDLITNPTQRVPINRVSEQFLKYYQDREHKNLRVDQAPNYLARTWKEVTVSQVVGLIKKNPLTALSEVLYVDHGDKIGFNQSIQGSMSSQTLMELRHYAQETLDSYNNTIHKNISLKDILQHIMHNYLKAKKETFGRHPLGNYVRQHTISELKQLPFLIHHHIL